MSRILFVATSPSSFILRDIRALKEKYPVQLLLFHSSPKWKAPFELIRHSVILLVSIFRYHLIICQFAGYHSFLPVLFGKIFRIPVLIISGGTESVSFPSIRYGNFHKKLLGWFTAFSIKSCSHLALKHSTLLEYNYEYDTTQPSHQGILAFVPDCKTPYSVIFNGYDENEFTPSGEKLINSFLTVAAGIEVPFTIPLKGIDLILKIAADFPDSVFTIAGCPETYSPPDSPANVSWIHIHDQKQLIELYRQHRFYLQLSMSEGFPNALCEAMLCECIPVGSAVNSIPEIIGDTGYLLRYRSDSELKNLITRMLKTNNFTGSEARNRICRNYPMSLRKNKLLLLTEKLIYPTL